MAERNFRIYLVDDDVKTLIMLKHNLEKKIEHPITVNVFAYGENCLDRMEEEKPDIVVLDYYLNAPAQAVSKNTRETKRTFFMISLLFIIRNSKRNPCISS